MNRRVTVSFIRYLISLAAFIIIGVVSFLWWAVGSQLPKESQLELDLKPEIIPPPTPPPYLKVVSYNIGHGQGIKDQAYDYRDLATTEKQLSLLADAITQMNADVVFLQEVDIDSNRTYHINELNFIKERSGHPYYACANVWEKNYLPFPYWPPAHHLGYLRAANCILSRYPLSNHERIVFDKPKSNPFWYNIAYIDRALQRVDLHLGDQKIALINIHLEAWEIDARHQQIKTAKEYIDKIKLPLIFGGDLNTLPPDASQKTGFADEPKDDYRQDHTLAWLFSNLKNIKIASPISVTNNPFELYTYRSDMPNRRMDHLFLLGDQLDFKSFRIVSEAGQASDHLPVMAEIKWH